MEFNGDGGHLEGVRVVHEGFAIEDNVRHVTLDELVLICNSYSFNLNKVLLACYS